MNEQRTPRDQQKGAILVLFAILLRALIGALGLAIDTGSTFESNRRMQTAADAAAFASAQELRGAKYDRIQTAAEESAKLNGFESDDETEIVVYRPPRSGQCKDDDTYVEVPVMNKAPLYFMNALVDEPRTIIARSVAGSRPGTSCIYVPNDRAANAFEARGTPEVLLRDCGITIHNSHANAAVTGGDLTAHGGALIQGTGVTKFNTSKPGYSCDRIWLNGGSVAKLEVPKDGTHKGVVFFQDPDINSNKGNVFNGNAEWDITGILYFPTTHVKMTGTFDTEAQDMLLISDTLEFSGTAEFKKLSQEFLPTVLTVARVVE